MFQVGRGPVPGIRASGRVPTKPRIASSKSCRLAKDSVFASSALACMVAGSAALGAIWALAAGQASAIAIMAAPVRLYERRDMRLSLSLTSGEGDVVVG